MTLTYLLAILISAVFDQLNSWFTSNLLSLNYDKTKSIHFKTINVHSRDILRENDKCITMDFNTYFLGTILGSTLHGGGDILLHKLSNLIRYVMLLEL
jgi:hypothetical protein